jgi:hypothetical protein
VKIFVINGKKNKKRTISPLKTRNMESPDWWKWGIRVKNVLVWPT